MTIKQLYENELVYWTQANQKFLGVSPINEEDDFSVIQTQIDADCEKYWNTKKPCKLAKKYEYWSVK